MFMMCFIQPLFPIDRNKIIIQIQSLQEQQAMIAMSLKMVQERHKQ